jgi:hypothetical protein
LAKPVAVGQKRDLYQSTKGREWLEDEEGCGPLYATVRVMAVDPDEGLATCRVVEVGRGVDRLMHGELILVYFDENGSWTRYLPALEEGEIE